MIPSACSTILSELCCTSPSLPIHSSDPLSCQYSPASSNSDYNVGIFANAAFSALGAPTSIAVYPASASSSGTPTAAPVLDLSGSPWLNTTTAYNTAVAALIKQYPILAYLFPSVLYDYVTANVWFRASRKASTSGLTYADVIRNIVANPAGYYVQISTAAYPNGAIRGQLAKY